MIDAELARQRRRNRTIIIGAVAALALIVVIAVTATVTILLVRPESETGRYEADTTSTTYSRAATTPSTETFPTGQPVVNGGITLTVNEVTTPNTYPRMTNSMRKNSGYDEYAPVAPRAGAKFVRVDAAVRNSGGRAIDLTCSWPVRAIVADASSRIFEPVDDLYEIQGTPECNEDLNPGFESVMTWIYEVPASANIRIFAFADTALDSQDVSAITIGVN